jgi:hypothetical protein
MEPIHDFGSLEKTMEFKSWMETNPNMTLNLSLVPMKGND